MESAVDFSVGLVGGLVKSGGHDAYMSLGRASGLGPSGTVSAS